MTTIEKYPLDRSKILKKTLVALMGWLTILVICGLFVGLAASAAGGPTVALTALGILAIIFILIAILQYWYETQYFAKYFYDIRSDFLIIRKGVFAPRETTLPYNKLQDVYMDQDLFDRLFNLWDVHVSTATLMSGFEAHIDGVKIANAEKLREMLLENIRGTKGN